MTYSQTPVRSALALANLILVTFCAPLAGMLSPPGDWYPALNKPEWNPPSWIFGPVWTVLYLMMAIAAWLLWRRDGRRRPLWLSFTQLLLNAAWTPTFFVAWEIGLALVAFQMAVAGDTGDVAACQQCCRVNVGAVILHGFRLQRS